MITWLVYGSQGWIGSMITDLLKECDEYDVKCGVARVDDTKRVQLELEHYKPDRVLCLVGRTHGKGHSTIDYLEQPGKLVENVRDNLFAPISLALMCKELNIHLTYLGTGCIFSGEEEYLENDLPDFFGSSYSVVKGFTDRLAHLLDNVLNVRIRMPIVGYHHPRNFITKIVSYDKVINVQNSMTVLEDLLPILVDLAKKKQCGTINLVNPGTISHNEILDLYKQIVDPLFTYKNFSIEEQDAILLSKRSNNKLDTRTLEFLYPDVPDIKTSIMNRLLTFKKSVS